MFILYFKIKSGKKGQLATFFTIVLIVFIMLAFIVVNLGKIGLQRTRQANAADAAALAAGSQASRLLNYMATFNEQIVSLYGGFAFLQFMIFINWGVDLAVFMVTLAEFFSSHLLGHPGMMPTFWQTLMYYGCIVADIESTKMEVDGVIMAQDYLIKAINDLNSKLPKITRDTARNYAFMQSDIDEPRINYTEWRKSKKPPKPDEDATWREYLNLETGFGAFMRLTLPAKNREPLEPDPTTTVLYWWSNTRNGEWVQNELDVIVRRMVPLQFETIVYQDIASSAQLRQELCIAIDNAPKMSNEMKWWLKAQINMAPGLLGLLDGIHILIDTLLPIYMGLLDFAAVLLAIGYALIEDWFHFEAICFFAGVNTGYLALTLGYLGPEARKIRFDDIRCAMRETVPNDLTLAVEVRRGTYPMNVNKLNYDVWQMQYPLITAKSTVRMNFGSFFPPNSEYMPVITNTR